MCTVRPFPTCGHRRRSSRKIAIPLLYPTDPPLLQGALSGGNFSLLAYGLSGRNYTLQSSGDLSATVAWHPLLSYTLTNTFQFFTNLGPTSPAFYRIKKQ